MKLQFWCPSPAISVLIVLLGLLAQGAPVRGGRGGGGFSRESPAAGGSFSPRSESKPEPQRSAQSSRQQTATGMQSSREQTATGMQSSAQQYHGAYPYATSANWDTARGLATATTGVAIGTVAASAGAAQPSSTAAYAIPTGSQLCASPMVIPVGGMNYFKCGSAWYTQAFGPSGPTYVSVAAPPGF